MVVVDRRLVVVRFFIIEESLRRSKGTPRHLATSRGREG